MRLYFALIGSAVLVLLALGGMDVLHGGWDAIAGGLALLGAMASLLAFALFARQLS
jgi:hypothetical protein